MDILEITIPLHVFAGFAALISGLGAIAAKKGSKTHIVSGRIYYYGMLGVFLTSSLMFLIEGERLTFLFLIGIFSFYSVHHGVRALKIGGRSARVKWHDFAYLSIVFISGSAMIALAFLYGLLQGRAMGVLFIVFGILTFLNSFTDLKSLLKLKYKNVKSSGPVIIHIVRMGGGYIATVTAFLVTNINFLPPLIVWIAPGIIGGVMVNRAKRSYIKNMRLRKKQKAG